MTLALALANKGKTIFVADKRQIFSSPFFGIIGFDDTAHKIHRVGDNAGVISAGDGNIGSLRIDFYVSRFSHEMEDAGIKDIDNIAKEFNKYLQKLTKGIPFRGSFIIGGPSLNTFESELYSVTTSEEPVKLDTKFGSVGCNDLIRLVEDGRGDEFLETEFIKNSPFFKDLEALITLMKEGQFLHSESEKEIINILGRIIELTYDIQDEHIKKCGPQNGVTIPLTSKAYDIEII